MQYIKNPQFIKYLLSQYGLEDEINDDLQKLMVSLIQLQTINLIQKSKIIAIKDKRQKIYLQDVQNSLKQLNHQDIYISNRFMHEDNKKFTLLEIQSNNLKNICHPHLFPQSQIKGQWLYLNDAIPNDILKQKFNILNIIQDSNEEIEQNIHSFNLVRTDDDRYYTIEEKQFLKKLYFNIKNNIQRSLIIKYKINNNKLVLPILKMIKLEPNNAGIICLTNLIKNPLIQDNIQKQIHHIFQILLIYRGQLIQTVSELLVKLVKKYLPIQNQLINILNDYQNEASYYIKCIYFQIQFNKILLKQNIHQIIHQITHYKENDQIRYLIFKLIAQINFNIPSFKQFQPSWPLHVPININSYKDPYLYLL